MQNAYTAANVFLHGAQVTSYIPEGQEPVLFLSELSRYEEGRAIRGCIPISWPWFAGHPSDSSKPAHGFARTTEWTVKKTGLLSGGGAGIKLGLTDNEATRTLWDYSFELELDITIESALDLALTMRNTGDERFSITSAFHSYYHVSEIGDIAICGLEDANFIEKVDGFEVKTQDDWSGYRKRRTGYICIRRRGASFRIRDTAGIYESANPEAIRLWYGIRGGTKCGVWLISETTTIAVSSASRSQTRATIS